MRTQGGDHSTKTTWVLSYLPKLELGFPSSWVPGLKGQYKALPHTARVPKGYTHWTISYFPQALKKQKKPRIQNQLGVQQKRENNSLIN